MARPVLVLLPGLLGDEAVWAHQRMELSAAQCVVPSFDGLDSITAMAQRVLALAPTDRFLLAGHSMGGRVALEVMRLAPERVLRLALLDTGVDSLPAGEAGARERDRRMALVHLARRSGMREMGRHWARGMVHPAHVDAPVFDAILDMVERQTPDEFERHCTALLARPDARAIFSNLRCPTLLVCGRQDSWSPLVRHEAMQRLLPGAQLAVIEDSGHMTTMEQPTAVSSLLAAWSA